MSYFRYHPECEDEIDQILERIKSNNPSAAYQWFLELENKCRRLANFPRMGRIRDDLIPDMYMFPFGNYLIFYDIEPNGIVVTHVADGRQDIHQAYARKSRTL